MSFALLAGGWVIVTAAIWLLHAPGPQVSFVLAGVGVEILGLVFAVRYHRIPNIERG